MKAKFYLVTGVALVLLTTMDARSGSYCSLGAMSTTGEFPTAPLRPTPPSSNGEGGGGGGGSMIFIGGGGGGGYHGGK